MTAFLVSYHTSTLCASYCSDAVQLAAAVRLAAQLWAFKTAPLQRGAGPGSPKGDSQPTLTVDRYIPPSGAPR